MPEKKQPLFAFDSEEDPAGIFDHQIDDIESQSTSINSTHLNVTGMNQTCVNPTGLNPTYPSKFIAQFIIVIGCLIITLVLTHGRSHPSTWTRARIHTAINASEESTFGYLFNSSFFQTIVKNGKNLIRLEEITQKIIDPNRNSSANLQSRTGIQPVQGQISRGFGPQVNPLDGQQQYSTGVEWIILPGTNVLAMEDGRVTSVTPANSDIPGDEGGIVTIDHGSGLSAIYHSIDTTGVSPGASIKKGTVLGKTLSSEFFLEVKRNGLLIDPLTLIMN